MKKLFAIVSLLCCLLTTQMYAAGSSTEGTEFWLTFMSNLKWQASDNALQLKLIVSSRYTTSVTVSNPNTSWSTTVNVPANGISEITVPVAQAYTTLVEKAAQTGLRVVSAKPISLYASNYADASYDATNVLPLASLTGNYIIQTYESNLFYEDIHYAKEFIVVATDNCTIEITPHARTTTGRLRNSTFSVTLKKGEVYQVQSTDENNDLSGTIVRASRPVAVFAGHQCATVPSDNEWCDHIVEQAMPVSQWGKQFPVTVSMIQQTNRVLITAVSDNTEVSINGSVVASLAALETYEFPLTASQQSCFVETSAPSACYLYLEGGMTNSRWGDPSSVYISPVEQMIQLMTFSTFQTPRSQYHYVNIVTTLNGKESIRLDGQAVRALFTPLEGNPDLVFARIKVEHGTHTIQTDVDGFTAWVYGMGDGESYAYTAGSATNALDAQILVDGENGIQAEMKEFCYNHNFTFSPQVNIPYSTAAWDFGDGTGKGYGSSVTHQYAKAGDYTVSMTVSSSSEEQTVTTLLHLVSIKKDTVYATVCDGDKYIFNNNEYTKSGTYTVTGLQTADGCDSIAVLKLNVNDSFFFEEEKSIATGQTYRWHGKRYTAGEYYDSLLTVHGCDSVYKLTLKEVDPPQKQYDTICYEPTYTFHGHEYPIPPVDKYKDQEFVDYVLEYRDNEACLTYKLYLAIVPTAEEHKEFSITVEAGQSYDFHGQILSATGDYTYEEPLGCHGTYSETLHLFVKPYPVIETTQILCLKDDSYDFYGRILTESGVYYDTVYSVSGISELRKLTLVDNRSYTILNITTDDPSYTLLGNTYTQSGSYTIVTKNTQGCDSIITLNLGIGGKCRTETEWTDYICKNGTFTWNNTTYTTSGDYTQSFETAAQCDSVVTLHLKQAEPAVISISASICEGDYYKWNGQKYDTEGVFTQTFTTAHGCDSVVTLTLTTRDTYTQTLDTSIILGNVFEWDGDKYTQDSIITKNYIAANGCDSVVTFNLSVIKTIYSEFTKEICEGSYFEWNEEKLTEQKDYYHTYLRPGRADSVVTLHLFVHPSYDMPAEKVTVKELQLPYIWQEEERNESTTYSKTLQTEDYLCDSIVHLELTVLPTIHKKIDTTICYGDYYEWKGVHLTEPTDDKDTIITESPDINDTIVTLHLQVYEPIEETVLPPVALCYGESYPWLDGKEYTTSQSLSYTLPSVVTGCDSVVSVELTIWSEPGVGHEYLTLTNNEPVTWNGVTYTSAGEYFCNTLHTSHGCDSTAWLHLSDKPVYDSTEVQTVCAGEVILWHERTLTPTETDNVFMHRITGEETDTVITLTVTLLPTYDMSAEKVTVKELQLPYIWQEEERNESTTYSKTLQTEDYLCDSIVHLELTVLPTIHKKIDTTICYGDYYEWKGVHLTEPTDDKDTIITESPDINDTIVTLHLQVYEPIEETVLPPVALCYGESYPWLDGKEYTTSQSLSYTLPSVVTGCDSVVSVELTIWPEPGVGHEYLTLTNNEPVTWNGVTYTSAGEYFCNTLQTSHGCDSTAWLHLSDKPVYDSTEVQTVCAGDDILWHERTLTPTETDHVFTHRITGEETDTLITLTVTVYPSYPNEKEEHTMCSGETYEWESDVYTESTTVTKTLQTQNGCDSVVTLYLTVHPTYDITDEEVIRCEGEQYEWEGTTYTKTTTDTKHLQTIHGCDSTVTRTFTFNPKTSSTETKFLFTGETYDWNGKIYSESGNYEYHTDNQYGCDSTAYLYLTVSDKPVKDSAEAKTICAGESFEWQGQTLTPTETNRIFTYRLTGEETDTLITLTVTVYPSYPNEKEEHTMCSGETYEWEGDVYAESTTVTKTLQTQNGCDSIVTLYLTVYPTYDITDEEVIRCEGEQYEWEGTTYTKTTTDTKHLQTVHGCDSTVTRTFTFNPKTSSTETKFLFTGETYDWNGTTYSESGNYEYHTDNRYGCDSTAYLYLTVSDKPVKDSTEAKTICAGESFEWQGQTVTPTETNRIFTHRITGEETDTLITLTVTVYPTYNLTDEEVIRCEGESYEWEGTTYTKTTTDTKHLQTIHGCDSTVTRIFTFHPTYPNEEFTATICANEQYEWEGDTYSEAGDYTKRLTSIYGCDSVVTLHLQVGKTYYAEVDSTICAGETCVWNGETYTQTGDYEQPLVSKGGCDSIVTLHLTVLEPVYKETKDLLMEGQTYTWNGVEYTTAGDYEQTFTAANGCDSVVTLHLAFNRLILTASVADHCADDPTIDFFLRVSEGAMEQVGFAFGEKEQAQGYRDTMVTYVEDTIRIPNRARAGHYSTTLTYYYKGQPIRSEQMTYTLLYPSSVLEQNWDDFIGVLTHDYNGGYDFTAFQWYENGQVMTGRTRSYIYDCVVQGYRYSALLTETDGTQLMTCELVASHRDELTVYPTLLHRRQAFRVRSSESAVLQLYDATGKHVGTYHTDGGEIELNAPPAAGLFLLYVEQDGKEKVTPVKLIVR